MSWEVHWFKEQRAAVAPLIERKKARRQHRRQRRELLAVNPHCDNCRVLLLPSCAHLVAGRLSCRPCVPIVRALAAVEGGEA